MSAEALAAQMARSAKADGGKMSIRIKRYTKEETTTEPLRFKLGDVVEARVGPNPARPSWKVRERATVSVVWYTEEDWTGFVPYQLLVHSTQEPIFVPLDDDKFVRPVGDADLAEVGGALPHDVSQQRMAGVTCTAQALHHRPPGARCLHGRPRCLRNGDQAFPDLPTAGRPFAVANTVCQAYKAWVQDRGLSPSSERLFEGWDRINAVDQTPILRAAAALSRRRIFSLARFQVNNESVLDTLVPETTDSGASAIGSADAIAALFDGAMQCSICIGSAVDSAALAAADAELLVTMDCNCPIITPTTDSRHDCAANAVRYLRLDAAQRIERLSTTLETLPPQPDDNEWMLTNMWALLRQQVLAEFLGLTATIAATVLTASAAARLDARLISELPARPGIDLAKSALPFESWASLPNRHIASMRSAKGGIKENVTSCDGCHVVADIKDLRRCSRCQKVWYALNLPFLPPITLRGSYWMVMSCLRV